ncbi:arginine/serine-rich protein PNISR-like [Centruroides sculpturatus]|uniref:arginine/serine-rich protein PNISR-like n=1 Tax=Centruroides sculpturatus TaxID=218467 RepID=UPI000C6D8541|nr:arginine/serine-rich protein PNISR-like [Centruroides sculpturatus]
MWAGAAWNQWALQPATYQNVPHEQIDWAALAKQWIQMQQRNQNEPPVAPPPPPPPPPPLLENPQNGNPESQSCELPLVHLPPPGHVPIPAVEGNEDSGPVAPPGATIFTPDDGLRDLKVLGFREDTLMVSKKAEKEQLLINSILQLFTAIFTPDDGLRDLKVLGFREDTLMVSKKAEKDPNFVQGDMMGGYWEGSWGMGGWVPPPGTIQNSTPGKETFEYGHMASTPTIPPQTYDYNHTSDQYSYNQMFTNDNQYEQYWPQVGPNTNIVSAPFLKRNKIAPPGEHSPRSEEEIPQLDAVKRKQLPAWIREGLEKMERERQRKLEKEKADKEQIERFKTVDSSQEKISGDDKSLSSVDETPIKSKFESESEDETESIKEDKESSPQVIVPSPEVVNKTEEEKQQELMLRVRRMLTEILLDVTTDQILNVAKEVHQKALSKGRIIMDVTF